MNKKDFNDRDNKISGEQISSKKISKDLEVDEKEIDFKEFFSILKRRKKILITASTTILSLSIFTTIIQRIFLPIYQGEFKILIKDPFQSEDSIDGKISQADIFENLASNESYNNDMPTLITLLKSPLLLKEIANKYSLTYAQLKNRITVKPGGLRGKEAKGILDIYLTTKNPKEDLGLLKELSRVYLEAAYDQKQKRLADGLEFLNNQAPELENKTAKLQAKVAKFRETYDLLEPSLEGAALKERQSILFSQILVFEAERSRLEKIKKEIIAGNITASGFRDAVGGSLDSPNKESQGLSIVDYEQNLLDEYMKVKAEIAKAKIKFLPTSKRIKNLELRLEKLNPLVIESQIDAVDSALAFNALKLEKTKSQIDSLSNLFKEQPFLIEEYETLKQRLLIAQKNLSGLVSARENFRLKIAQSSVPWRIISDPIIDLKPIRPSIPKNFAIGLFLSVIFGVLIAFLRDKFDDVYHSEDEIKYDFSLPVLGNIPYLKQFEGLRQKEINVLDNFSSSLKNLIDDKKNQEAYQNFVFQESLRNIYSSLKFLKADDKIKIFSITSTIPSEGKSIVNILFAKTLSEFGRKVLLIDCDMRKPELHKRLGINNLNGLSNLLTNENLNYKDVTQKIKRLENVEIITAGIKPPDPTRLINSSRMKDVISELKESNEYSFIVFDAPPLSGLADASLLAENLDGLIYLISLNNVKRTLVKKTFSNSNSLGMEFLGIITNQLKDIKIDPQKDNYYAYYEQSEKQESVIKNNDKSRDSKTYIQNLFEDNLTKLKLALQDFINWIEK